MAVATYLHRDENIVATYAAMKSGLKGADYHAVLVVPKCSNLCRDEKRTERI